MPDHEYAVPALQDAEDAIRSATHAELIIGDREWQICEPLESRGATAVLYTVRRPGTQGGDAVLRIEPAAEGYVEGWRLARQELDRFGSVHLMPTILDEGSFTLTVDEKKLNGGGLSCVVMERLELELFDPVTEPERLACGSAGLPSRDIAAFRRFFELSRVLSEFHTCGLVHTDIKDDNVMLNLWGGLPTVKLVDLGLCARSNERLDGRPFLGYHTPPEFRDAFENLQERGASVNSQPIRARYDFDVYAFGKLLDAARALWDERLARGFDDFVERCVAPSRYPNAVEAHADLDGIRRRLGISWSSGIPDDFALRVAVGVVPTSRRRLRRDSARLGILRRAAEAAVTAAVEQIRPELGSDQRRVRLPDRVIIQGHPQVIPKGLDASHIRNEMLRLLGDEHPLGDVLFDVVPQTGYIDVEVRPNGPTVEFHSVDVVIDSAVPRTLEDGTTRLFGRELSEIVGVPNAFDERVRIDLDVDRLARRVTVAPYFAGQSPDPLHVDNVELGWNRDKKTTELTLEQSATVRVGRFEFAVRCIPAPEAHQ